MKRDPIAKVRSPWIEDPKEYLLVQDTYPMRTFWRNISDGYLAAIVGIEPEIGWHLSISFRNHRGRLTRYPTWDEIADARERLLPDELGFVMHLPPLTTDEYVALHLTTMHLHQHPEPTGDLP